MELRLIQPGDPICPIEELSDSTSLKFRILEEGRAIEAFLIRFSGRYYAYKNRCAHMALTLDLEDNDFFTIDLPCPDLQDPRRRVLSRKRNLFLGTLLWRGARAPSCGAPRRAGHTGREEPLDDADLEKFLVFLRVLAVVVSQRLLRLPRGNPHENRRPDERSFDPVRRPGGTEHQFAGPCLHG